MTKPAAQDQATMRALIGDATRASFFGFLSGAAICLGCWPATPAFHHGVTAAARPTMDRLARGVFEVVTPKLEDDAVKYQDPLPVALLPFRERTSRLSSVGTAFAISRAHFVTAAHVLPGLSSLRSRFYLRTSTGELYEIGRVTKYSQYRDLVEFELVSSIPDVIPLDLSQDVRVGDQVLTVGNALGEGVVVRGGSLTSFTPEEMDGKWRNIRFTAPASPGNSGGPLIDEAGRVAGVVVRKSNTENLNYAVPIQELDRLSRDKGEFWIKGLAFGEDNKQTFSDWRFEAPLPAAIPALRQAAQRSLMDFTSKAMSDFDAKYGSEIFPRNSNLVTYLRRPTIPFGLGRFSIDREGHWRTSSSKYTEKELSPGQWANVSIDGRYAQVIIDRPRGTPLLRFFQSPKTIADAIVKLLGLKRPFAGKQIPIETFGEPSEHERWVDELGRPWFIWVWHLGFADEAVVLDCLSNPAGLACEWKIVPFAVESFYRLDIKRAAKRVTFGYYGLIRDWIEFLALPDVFKPKALAASDVTVRLENSLMLNIDGFQGTIDAPFLSADSRLHVYMGLDNPLQLTSKVIEVRLRPRIDKAYRLGIEKIFEPTENSPERDVLFWKKIQRAEAPFNGAVALDNNENTVRTIGRPDRKTTPEVLYIRYCRSGTEDDRADLEKACERLSKTLKILEP